MPRLACVQCCYSECCWRACLRADPVRSGAWWESGLQAHKPALFGLVSAGVTPIVTATLLEGKNFVAFESERKHLECKVEPGFCVNNVPFPFSGVEPCMGWALGWQPLKS